MASRETWFAPRVPGGSDTRRNESSRGRFTRPRCYQGWHPLARHCSKFRKRLWFPRFPDSSREARMPTMRISAITARDTSRGYAIKLADIRAPLTAVYGVAHSGKSAVASLVGQRSLGNIGWLRGEPGSQWGIDRRRRRARYRVRGSHDAAGHTRLTVAALDSRRSITIRCVDWWEICRRPF